MTSKVEIGVFGAGALGCFFTALLSQAGHRVTLIARGAHLAAIRNHGISVRHQDASFTARPAVVTDSVGHLSAVDAVLLAVKTDQVADAARSLRNVLREGAKVLPLQNGVEAPEVLRSTLGDEHALYATCHVVALLEEPGRVLHVGVPPRITLGEINEGPLAAATEKLVAALRSAGITVLTPGNIRAALWEKLLFISAVSGLGALSRSSIGHMCSSPATRAFLVRLMDEVREVAAGHDVQLRPTVVDEMLTFMDGMPYDSTASMQRDMMAGKPSELDGIVGAVVRKAREAGVATPAMDFVYECLLPQERKARETT